MSGESSPSSPFSPDLILFSLQSFVWCFRWGWGAPAAACQLFVVSTAQDEEVPVRQSAALSRTWRRGELGLLSSGAACEILSIPGLSLPYGPDRRLPRPR